MTERKIAVGNDRIDELKKNRKRPIRRQDIPLRDRIYRESVKEHADESVEKQFAYGFRDFLAYKPILIQEEDLLAGYAYHYSYNTTFPADGPEDFDPAVKSVFHMDMDREIRETIEALELKEGDPVIDDMKEFQAGMECWLFKHWHSGHFLAGYEILLKKGFGGILEEERRRIAAAAAAKEGGSRSSGERDTLEAFSIVTEACAAYIGRYQKMAERMEASAGSHEQKERMRRIRESCSRIAVGKPKCFFDAIQLLWFAHELALCESYPSAVSFGRFDTYLYPFYRKDLKEGRITREEALELIKAFWIKCSTNTKGYQNLMLGGTDQNGDSIVNDLTYLCMEASEYLKFDQPSLTFRCTDQMSEQTWDAIFRLIKTGMGFPALFCEEVCLEAKRRIGIRPEDLYRYAAVGCVEITIPGMEYSLTEAGRLNLPKILELMFHQGRDPGSGQKFQLYKTKTAEELDQMEDFEMLLEWYLDEMEHWIRLGVRCINAFDKMYGKCYPLPYLSTLMEGCIENGTDVSAGGAVYNSSAFNMGGIATVADSLSALKKIIYEWKLLSLSEYIRILDEDFAGQESIRQLAVRACPKFGNDREDVDEIMEKLVQRFCNVVEEYTTPRGGTFRTGLYTVEDHAIMGSYTGATPDGRKKGEALSNSCSPVQGRDRKGPTALLNSVNCLPLERATNGMVLDLKFTPEFMEEKKNIQAIRDLIRVYFSRGGMEVQLSVVSKETLIDAQRHPEEHQDLVVRVSGFSAYFTSLRKVTQDEIIKRTEVSGL